MKKKPFEDTNNRVKPNAKLCQDILIIVQNSILATLQLSFEAIFCYRSIGRITTPSQINSSRINMCPPWPEVLISYYVVVSWHKWEQTMAHGIAWKCGISQQACHFTELLSRWKKILDKCFYNTLANSLGNVVFNNCIIKSDYEHI